MALQSDFILRNQISHVEWPQIPNPWAGGVISALYQMDQSQYWPVKKMQVAQLSQLKCLIEYALKHSPLYSKLYKGLKLENNGIEKLVDLSRLPTISRALLQSAGNAWHATTLPQDHGAIGVTMTSGSTGRPLESQSTTLSYLMQLALVLRSHQWAGRDTSAPIAFINEMGSNSTGVKYSPFWQESLNPIIKTGPSLTVDVKQTIEDITKIIAEYAPPYLVGYPSVIKEIANHCKRIGIELPSLKQIGCFGEVLPQPTRQLFDDVWGIPTFDGYSAKELGPIALQCPECEAYHVQSDAVIVEILRDDDQPCEPGETGRVVVTSLHNFAAPMIRYEIGDYAEVGASCKCGRTLPVLNKIAGRQRNLLKYPNGTLKWPSLREADFSVMTNTGFPEIRQFQIVQKTLSDLKVRLAVERSLSPEQEQLATLFIRQQLGEHWLVSFSYCDEIERSGRGKFEDFVSLCHDQ